MWTKIPTHRELPLNFSSNHSFNPLGLEGLVCYCQHWSKVVSSDPLMLKEGLADMKMRIYDISRALIYTHTSPLFVVSLKGEYEDEPQRHYTAIKNIPYVKGYN